MTDPQPAPQLDLKGCRLLRKQIQDLIESLAIYSGGSRERSLVKTKLQEAKMWLGKEMNNLGSEDLNFKRDDLLNKENHKDSGRTIN